MLKIICQKSIKSCFRRKIEQDINIEFQRKVLHKEMTNSMEGS